MAGRTAATMPGARRVLLARRAHHRARRLDQAMERTRPALQMDQDRRPDHRPTLPSLLAHLRTWTLAEVGRQALIGRDELVPPRLAVAALTPGEVGGETFGVDLPSGPVEGDLVQGHAPDLDDQDGLAAVGGQRGLDGLVEWLRAATLPPGLVRLPGRHQQPPWGLARFDAPGAFQVSGFDVQAELSAGAEVALDLAVPAGQAAGIGECRPQVVDIGVVAVFDAHDARAVC